MDYKKLVIRALQAGAGKPVEGMAARVPPPPSGFQMLQGAAEQASQDYTKSLIPPPRTWSEDLMYRTGKLSRDEVMASDPVWGKARQLSETTGQPFSKSFRDLFDMAMRNRGEPLTDAELANIMLQAAQHGIK